MSEHNLIRGLLRTIRIKWNNETQNFSGVISRKILIPSGHVVIVFIQSLSRFARDQIYSFYYKG